MPDSGGSMMVCHDVLMSVAAAMRADAADLDAAIERLEMAAGATGSLARWPTGHAFRERAEAALAALKVASRYLTELEGHLTAAAQSLPLRGRAGTLAAGADGDVLEAAQHEQRPTLGRPGQF